MALTSFSVTGQAIHRQTAQQIVDQILACPAETKIMLLAPLVVLNLLGIGAVTAFPEIAMKLTIPEMKATIPAKKPIP